MPELLSCFGHEPVEARNNGRELGIFLRSAMKSNLVFIPLMSVINGSGMTLVEEM